MSITSQLQPEKVFHYFETLSHIPHGSYHEKEISDFLLNWAKDLGLEASQDPSWNLIIKKPGTPGYEDAPAVILQGHMDMVCEKEKNCPIDMDTQPIELMIQGDYLTAKGTTLGGDDGIAIAMAMAILDSDDIPHPPLEVVWTTQEEVGLNGALTLDPSDLKARILLNLDNEQEGIFISSCAGGIRVECKVPVNHMVDMAVRYDLTLTGITGGHSGMEIGKYGMNSNIVTGRMLHRLSQVAEFWIHDIKGGFKDNAIPVETELCLYVAPQDCQALEDMVAEVTEELKNEYRVTDPDFQVILKKGPEEIRDMLDTASTERIIQLLMSYPYGVQRYSSDIPGLVESSLNLGIMALESKEMVFKFSIRSSVASAKNALADKVVFLTETAGGTCSFSGDYPGWEYKEDSKVRDLAVQVWDDLFDTPCQVSAIHAGLECGIFSDKIPGLDCIAYGPDLFDVHTPRERLSISSTKRIWEFTLALLKNLK